MDKEILEKYSEIVIRLGVNLYKGQCLAVTAGIDDYDFALILSETAYKNGAKFVDLNIISNALTKAQIDYSDEAHLDFMPQYRSARFNEIIANDWANIRIDNTGESGILQNADPDRLDIITKASRIVSKRYMEMASKHILTWCVIASPNLKWAQSIFKDSAGNTALSMLDSALIKILRLDEKDPVDAWQKHSQKLHERCSILNELALDRLLIKSLKFKTDLEIGLTDFSRWAGGPKITPDGREYIPNIPTEEVFTTPHYSRTNGIVHTTKPVKVMETIINGAWFEFKDGKVADFGSDNNSDILEKFLNTDSRSRYLGEAALVDKASRIYGSNLIFNSILYDENASCHIALGNGYPSCLANGRSLKTKDEIMKAGCNVSLVHTDFMFGSDDIEIAGIGKNGSKTVIIKDGVFCI